MSGRKWEVRISPPDYVTEVEADDRDDAMDAAAEECYNQASDWIEAGMFEVREVKA